MNEQIKAVFDEMESAAIEMDISSDFFYGVLACVDLLIERGILATGPAWEEEG